MACPNGHRGGVFCCEDHVNQCAARFYERYREWSPNILIPVTYDQWKAYQKLLGEDEKGERDELQDGASDGEPAPP